MLKEITIGVDMDNTIEDLVTPWLDALNRKHGLRYRLSDITDFDLQKCIPELTREQIYEPLHDPEFFETVRPYADAQKYLQLLNADKRFRIYIVTNTHHDTLSAKMKSVLFRYFDFIDWKQLIKIKDKQLLNLDYLIDDYEGNLIGGTYKGILYTMPYNITVQTEKLTAFGVTNSKQLLRADNWEEIYKYFTKRYAERS